MLAVHLATFLWTNLYNLFSLIQGYFKTNPLFFIAHFSHIVLFFVAARLILLYFGTGWLPWLVAVALATVSQVGREDEREREGEGGTSVWMWWELGIFINIRLETFACEFLSHMLLACD